MSLRFSWLEVSRVSCATGAVVVFRCSSTSQSRLYFVAHFCCLHSLGSMLQPSLIFSFSRLLELDLRCPLLLQSTNQKAWKLVFPTQNTILPNYESIKTSSLPLSFPFQDGRQAKKNSDKKLHNLSLLCLFLVSALLTKGFSLEADTP